MTHPPIVISPEVAQALADNCGVVALESTIISHGLPRPENLRVALEVEATVRTHGGVPATSAILDGTVHVGRDEGHLDQVANRDDISKVSVRDIDDHRPRWQWSHHSCGHQPHSPTGRN